MPGSMRSRMREKPQMKTAEEIKAEQKAEEEERAKSRKRARKVMRALAKGREPEILEAVKGMEGMKVAHEILLSSRAIGFLIGGLLSKFIMASVMRDDLRPTKMSM